MGLDSRHQLARAEWLGHVVITAEFKTQHTIYLVGARGQKNNRSSRQLARLAETPAEIEAILPRKHEIEHNEIRMPAFQLAKGVVGTVEKAGLEPPASQVVFDER